MHRMTHRNPSRNNEAFNAINNKCVKTMDYERFLQSGLPALSIALFERNFMILILMKNDFFAK